MAKDKVKFYHVNKDYLKFLRQEEIKERGFTRIPEYTYENNQKFVCGVILSINGFEYYAPISSFKTQQHSNILITDKKNNVLSSIRFCFMFPVPKSEVSTKDFSKESFKHQRLLFKEYGFCLIHIDDIYKKSKEIYDLIIDTSDTKLTNNYCDFKFLQHSMMKYLKLKEIKEALEQVASITEERK